MAFPSSRNFIRARPAAALTPAFGVLAVWAALLPADAGYFQRDWAPAGLVIAGLWLATVAGSGRILPNDRCSRVALGALGALALFAFIGMSWAQSPGTAWSTANQFLTVVLTAWTLALVPWSAGSAQLFMGLFALITAVVLGGSLLAATAADDLSGYFIENRWAQPVGYPNGLGNLGFLAALPMLAVSADPRRAAAVKVAALGLATFLAACGLLPQSRGAVLAALAALPVLVALSPRRWRVVSRIVIAGGALAAFSGPILELHDVVSESDVVSGALSEAARAIVLATLAATVLGVLPVLAESRLRLGQRGVRAARLGGIAAVALALASAAGAAAVNADRIQRVAEKQRDAWENPGRPYADHDGRREGSRLLDPNPLQRYEYWHVSLDAFADHPLRGLGPGGFELRYTRVRAYPKYANYPHALFMRVLAEGGVVGVLGVLAFAGAVLLGLGRGLRRADGEARTVVAAAVASALLFTLHAQLDWIEEFPVLAGAALGFLLIALAVVASAPWGPARRPRLQVAVATVLAAAAFASIGVQYVALRYKEQGAGLWRTDLQGAYRALDRAAALDPLEDAPKLIEGTIALQKGDLERARRAFEAALEREEAWLAHFELAIIDAAEGHWGAAARQLDAALRLNPREAAILAVQEEIRARQAIDPVLLNRRLFESPLFKTRRLS